MTRQDPVGTERLVIPVAVVPVRRDPAHRSELVSQWILGETITVEDTDGSWVRARGPDGYSGWTPSLPFRHVSPPPAAWADTATWYSLGTGVSSTLERGGTNGLKRLPWGARVGRPGGNEVDDVVLPDGEVATPVSPARVVSWPVHPSTSAEIAEAVVRLAAEWRGVPYLWGGRTELGADCSGFVQSVFFALGVELPRDSHEQAIATDEVGDTEIDEAFIPGDLLFFAPEGDGVTHVAISLGARRIIHAASSNGAVRVDDLDAPDPLSCMLSESITAHTRPAAG